MNQNIRLDVFQFQDAIAKRLCRDGKTFIIRRSFLFLFSFFSNSIFYESKHLGLLSSSFRTPSRWINFHNTAWEASLTADTATANLRAGKSQMSCSKLFNFRHS
jgi:hypothetical protein